MEREVSFEEISDGKRYGKNDLVKLGCNNCEGCFACCSGMDASIILDPFDLHFLSVNLKQTFEALMLGRIELNAVDGLVLPNLKMAEDTGTCTFLNSDKRCSIHPFRPGICRLFPLGRIYEEQSFQYFLQVHECKRENRTKMKIKNWLAVPNLNRYEQFIVDWHYFLKKLQAYTEKRQEASMYVLNEFYCRPYDEKNDFYIQFWERLDLSRDFIKRLGE